MTQDFFEKRPNSTPTIYAYELVGVDSKKGLLKIGFTNRDVEQRIKEQIGASRLKHKTVLSESAMKHDGSNFTDRDVHRLLRKNNIPNPDGEWFDCSVKEVKKAILALQNGDNHTNNRTENFGLRPEQQQALDKTIGYFNNIADDNKTPHFLWNAKMRFGKTFTTYQLAKKMGWTKILILTFKPAVENAWQDDLNNHVDFEHWQFISRHTELTYEIADKKNPIVCFGSFQDYLGTNKTGGIKQKNEWVHSLNWDCVIFDEYHYGAWRERAKGLTDEKEADNDSDFEKELKVYDGFDEDTLPITTNHYLYLSGTPFKAIASGEFIEEQIYNWTYSDEQKAKNEWVGNGLFKNTFWQADISHSSTRSVSVPLRTVRQAHCPAQGMDSVAEPVEASDFDNPYASLPRMIMMTYQLPDSIIDIAKGGEFNEFDLNTFFKAEGDNDTAKFTYEDDVQKWLDLIRGNYLETSIDTLKLGSKKAILPFSDSSLLHNLSHTFWFLPRVNACFAMRNLLAKRQNRFYHDYDIIVVAGNKAGTGADALKPVMNAMQDPLKTKTITLSCGKLTTGVSVKPWTGILMLRNLTSPESYFQSAFRVQTPWVIKNPDDKSPNKTEILKQNCYVFDFAPNRALRQLADYACSLSIDGTNPETKVQEFINFLPVLAHDGSSMKHLDATSILDIAHSGTSATLLAKRWESALLVNVDNRTLERLMKNDDAMNALMNIEGFRNLNQDIETIINKSETIKEMKQKSIKDELSPKEKTELSDAEKEYKSKRKEIQEKLIKFSTRIPVFMYLTDYREHSLKDVIQQLEPALFKKITGLTQQDFDLLVSLNVFNQGLMNDAVYKFKRYEDSSLNYTGVAKHENLRIGLYDTVLGAKEVL